MTKNEELGMTIDCCIGLLAKNCMAYFSRGGELESLGRNVEDYLRNMRDLKTCIDFFIESVELKKEKLNL